jgi:hypothetical protein
VYAGPKVDELPIAAAEARRVVGEYVARNGLGRRFDDLRVEVGVDQAASTVTVEFAVRVPLLLSGDTAGIPVSASASATAPLD